MAGPIAEYLGDDHLRLDALLRLATAKSDAPDLEAYGAFRRGLLRHIGLEEKLLLVAAERARGGEPLPVAARLRLDHGAIAALLVPPPSRVVVAALRDILARHNALEEGTAGLYATCDGLLGAQAAELVRRFEATPEPRVSAHASGPLVEAATRRALARAGYDLADYEPPAG